MSITIMQQLSEMFLVFLQGDLPGMLALFLCGVTGWLVTKQVNRRYSSLVQFKATAKSLDADFCDEPQSPTKSKPKARTRSSRSSKSDSTSVMHGMHTETEPPSFEAVTAVHEQTTEVETSCSQTVDDDDDAALVMPCSDAPCETDTFDTPAAVQKNGDNESQSLTNWAMSDDAKLAKIMTKRAERKARKLQEQLALQASETSCDLPEAPDKKNDETSSKLEPSEDVSHVPTNSSEDHDEYRKTNLVTEYMHCGSTAIEDRLSSDSEIALKEVISTPSGVSEKETSCGSSESTPSEDGTGLTGDGFSTSEDVGKLITFDDGWMNSFEELQDISTDMQLPVSHEQGTSFVHVDNNTGAELWFEPVKQTEDGTQLYTDGQQLYQAVCVRVEDIMPSDGTYVASAQAFQNVPTGATFYQSMPTDGTFQQLPSDMTCQASNMSFATADGPCFGHVPSDGIDETHMQQHFGDGHFQYPMAAESFNDNYVGNHHNPAFSSKMVSPTFQDDEDEMWNMCWDFVSSASWSK